MNPCACVGRWFALIGGLVLALFCQPLMVSLCTHHVILFHVYLSTIKKSIDDLFLVWEIPLSNTKEAKAHRCFLAYL